jgi:hypothetical protein
MNESSTVEHSKIRHAVYVRLTQEEHGRLAADAAVAGLSPPQLLRRRYFSRYAPLRPLMVRGEGQCVLSSLSRIGTNINQIARKVNSGFREGFIEALTQIAQDLHQLRCYVSVFDGHR